MFHHLKTILKGKCHENLPLFFKNLIVINRHIITVVISRTFSYAKSAVLRGVIDNANLGKYSKNSAVSLTLPAKESIQKALLRH